MGISEPGNTPNKMFNNLFNKLNTVLKAQR